MKKILFLSILSLFLLTGCGKSNTITCTGTQDEDSIKVKSEIKAEIKDNKVTKIPVFNKSEVFDVTGAGDTVTAVYTLALACGAEPVYAAIIGNIAAGIVVKQFGCATTKIEEIKEVIEQRINKI